MAATRNGRHGARGGQFVPPFESSSQQGVTPAHFLQIVGGICGIRKRGNDVADHKPPFVVMDGAANLLALEQGNAGLRRIGGGVHVSGCWEVKWMAICALYIQYPDAKANRTFSRHSPDAFENGRRRIAVISPADTNRPEHLDFSESWRGRARWPTRRLLRVVRCLFCDKQVVV